MLSLSIFDFDGTLFRSPSKPEGWEGGWWGRPESLLPPFVPLRPYGEVNDAGEPWWNLELLKRLENEEFDGNDPYIVTGRLKKRFYERFEELLSDVGLDSIIEEGRARLSRGSTLPWKLETFREIIEQRLDDIEDMGEGWDRTNGELIVTIYEDRQEHIPYFIELLEEFIEMGVISSLSEVVTVSI